MAIRKIPEIKNQNIVDKNAIHKGYDGYINTTLMVSIREGKVKQSMDFFRSEFDKVIAENKYVAERQAIDEHYRIIQSVAIKLLDKGLGEIAVNALKWMRWEYEANKTSDCGASSGFDPYTYVIPNSVYACTSFGEKLLEMSFEELKKLNSKIKSLEDTGNHYIAHRIVSTLHFYGIRQNIVEAISMLNNEELTIIYDRRGYKEYGRLVNIQGYYEDLIDKLGMPEADDRKNQEYVIKRTRWANMFALNLLRLSKISENLYDDDIFSWAYFAIRDALGIDCISNHKQAYNALNIAQKAVKYVEESSKETIENDRKIILSQLRWLSNKTKNTPPGTDREVEEAIKELQGDNEAFKTAMVGIWVSVNLMNIGRLGYLND